MPRPARPGFQGCPAVDVYRWRPMGTISEPPRRSQHTPGFLHAALGRGYIYNCDSTSLRPRDVLSTTHVTTVRLTCVRVLLRCGLNKQLSVTAGQDTVSGSDYVQMAVFTSAKSAKYVEIWDKYVRKRPEFSELRPKFECWT